MRNDLAALIPPFVVAAAFIAGVAVLLRREMAPRLRRRRGEDGSADMPGTGPAPSSVRHQLRQQDQSADDTSGTDSGSPRSCRTSGGSSDAVTEDETA
jgi:hypothetical protein